MTETPGLALVFDGALAEVRFDRPGKRNAIDRAMWRGLPGLLETAVARRETRSLILRGAGGVFAAGADIAEFDAVFADVASTGRYLDDMIAATRALASLPIPVIALIEGLCIGAGVAVALACDLRFAAADARFAVTPAKLGLAYSLTDTRRLVGGVGLSAARDLLFSGRTIDADAALGMGLVDAVFAPETLEAEVRARARAMTEVSAATIAATKTILAMIESGKGEESEASRALFTAAPRSADFAEGLAAFRAGRPARFPPR
jgi:enoyl-CoA hydratase/carnithine racemase